MLWGQLRPLLVEREEKGEDRQEREREEERERARGEGEEDEEGSGGGERCPLRCVLPPRIDNLVACDKLRPFTCALSVSSLETAGPPNLTPACQNCSPPTLCFCCFWAVVSPRRGGKASPDLGEREEVIPATKRVLNAATYAHRSSSVGYILAQSCKDRIEGESASRPVLYVLSYCTLRAQMRILDLRAFAAAAVLVERCTATSLCGVPHRAVRRPCLSHAYPMPVPDPSTIQRAPLLSEEAFR